MRWITSLFCVLVTCGFASAQPKVPDGFKVELVLQAPDIEAPTALAVAPNGDVYYAEDPMDMTGPPTKNLDKIYLLKGGDPKKKILVADQMWAVMGLEVVRDKLYVVHAPHVTAFTLDEEGKPIKREELFDDLGPKVAGLPGFNDHIPSGIRMGMDGWLYVSIGDKGIPKMSRIPMPLRGTEVGKQMENIGSVHVAEGRHRQVKEGHHISLEGGGVIRFRPDGTGLEVFASGTRNHLDVPMDEHDRIFVRDNTDDGLGWNTKLMYLPRGAFMGYPWAYKKHPEECLPAITDFGGGSPCGGWVYCDDGLPPTYQGRIFHCEWGKQKIGAVKVKPKGAGFEFVDEIDFMLPGDLKDFRPFTLRPAHDGRGFYVTDWAYNGWSAKVNAGRLWKVTYTKDDVKPKPRGTNEDSVEKLIEALGHPAHSERVRAQRELIARGGDALPTMHQLVGDEKRAIAARRHGLWVTASIGSNDGDLWRTLSAGLRSSEPSVRATAARILGNVRGRKIETGGKENSGKPIPEQLRELLKSDSEPTVRAEAAIALRSFDHLFPLWAEMLAEKEPNVRYQLLRQSRAAAANLAPGGTPAGTATFRLARWSDSLSETEKLNLLDAFEHTYVDMSTKILVRILDQGNTQVRKRAIGIVASLAKDRPPYSGGWWGTQPAGQKPPARTVSWQDTPFLRFVLTRYLNVQDEEVRMAVLQGLIDLQDPETLAPLAKRLETHKETELVRAIAALKLPQAASILAVEADNAGNPEALRLEAIKGLEALGIQEAVDTLIFAGLDGKPEAVRARAIEALGTLKAKDSRPVFLRGLRDDSALIRKTSVLGLAKLNDPKLADRLLPLLVDNDLGVMQAAIQSVGNLKYVDAVPFLLPLVNPEQTRIDAIAALAKMPDQRAVSAYLIGLESKNNDVRTACRSALTSLREPLAKVLDQLAERKELRAEVIPELRSIYAAFEPIRSWHLIGPFDGMSKEHPPEIGIDLEAAYKSGDRELKWRKDQRTRGDQGRVNLQAMFNPNSDTAAYAYAEIDSSSDREATLAIGSDDTCTIWLNGKRVFHFGGNRGWAPNQDQVNVRLEKGKNKLLVKIGNNSGPWDFSVSVTGETSQYAFLKGGAKKLDLEEYRKFARANKGDALKGEKLFGDLKGLACVKCHAVNGQGGSVGPDMTGIALKYNKEDLIASILEPSKNIANGYETIRVTTLDGKTLTGVFKGETGESVNLADDQGKLVSVAKQDIESKQISPVSLMPNGLNDGMTLQDFADLIAFLEARREGKK